MAFVVTLALVATAAAVVPAGADDLRHREKKIGKKVRAAAHDVEASSKQLTRARSRLAVAQRELGVAQGKLRQTQSRLNVARAHDARMRVVLIRANEKLDSARAKLEAAELDVVRQRDEMGATVARNYQQGNPELIGLAAMLSSGNPKEITSQVNAVHNLMNRQAGMLDALKSAEARAEALEEKVREHRRSVAQKKAEAAQVVVRRTALEKRASAARTRVAGLVSARAAAKATARRALAHDKRILRKLKREERRIKQMLMRRSNNGRHYRGNSNGYLTRPVPGAVTSPYGYRTHPIYGYYGLHDGTDFRVGCGEAMKAVADGTVVSRYWSDVYGNRLVLDLGRVNGKSLAVIYNHATSYRYGDGDRVRRGATIGYGGSTGWSTGCHLHFSVLVNGNTVDPMPWF